MAPPRETKIGVLKVPDGNGSTRSTTVRTAGEFSRQIEFDPPLTRVTRSTLPRLLAVLARAGLVAEREDTKL